MLWTGPRRARESTAPSHLQRPAGESKAPSRQIYTAQRHEYTAPNRRIYSAQPAMLQRSARESTALGMRICSALPAIYIAKLANLQRLACDPAAPSRPI